MSLFFRFILISCLAAGCLAAPARAQEPKDPESLRREILERIEHDRQNLVTCYAHACGLTFQCNPQWRVRVVDEYSTIITISADPFVTLAISRIDSDIRLLGKLTKSFFQDKQIYMDNFRKEYVPFGGGDAIELKAFSKFEPGMRYQGYFYVNDNGLNSVFFAVYPKQHWDEYKFFIKEIAGTFKRI